MPNNNQDTSQKNSVKKNQHTRKSSLKKAAKTIMSRGQKIAALKKLKNFKISRKSEKSTGADPSISQEANLLADLKNQHDSLRKKYEYLSAEYANYQKQTNKQIDHLKKYDGQFFIENLLNSVIDDFDTAMEWNLTDKSLQDFKIGIQMIYDRFKKVLKNAGVIELESSGKPFDPAVHSAIGSASSDKVPPEHVLSVLKKAYMFHDKLIRPALVIVAEDPKQKKNE